MAEPNIGNERLSNLLDVAIPAAALIGSVASPQLGKAIGVASSVADSRARAAAQRQRMALLQRQVAMQEAEAERAARIFEAQEPGLAATQAVGAGISEVLNRPEAAQPFSPINLDDPLATSGPVVGISPTPQTQFARLKTLLDEQGGSEGFALAGGPFQQGLAGRQSTQALGLRERETALGERTQGFREREADRQAGFTERQLGQADKTLSLKQRQLEQDVREFNQKMSGVDLLPGAVVRDAEGREQKEWIVQDKRTGAPIGTYHGSVSEPPPTGFASAYNDLIEASRSGDQTKTAFALNNMLKTAAPKGGITFSQDDKGNMTLSVGGTGVSGSGQQKAQRELIDAEANLLKFDSAIDRFEALTEQGQLGAGGALQSLFQQTVGQIGEVRGAVKNLISGTFGPEAAKKITILGSDGNLKELPYPKYFNKNVTQREIIANSLGFMRAALYGQTGRALSEREFKAFVKDIMQGDVNSQRAVIEVLRDEIAEAQRILQFKSGRMQEIGQQQGLAVPVPGLEQFLPQQPQPQAPQAPTPAQMQPQAPAGDVMPTDAELEEAARQAGISVDEAKRRLGLQ